MNQEEIKTPHPQDFAQELLSVSEEMKDYAFKYLGAREEHSENYNKIIYMIYKTGLYKNKASFENKIPMLFENDTFRDEAIRTVSQMNKARAQYKGFEYVLKAYQAKITAIQSVIKFMQQGEINENLKAKYINDYS